MVSTPRCQRGSIGSSPLSRSFFMYLLTNRRIIMKIFAKVKYSGLSLVVHIKSWYEGLTNDCKMKGVIGLLIIGLLTSVAHNAELNWKLNKQERFVITNYQSQVMDLTFDNQVKDSLIADYQYKQKVTKQFVKDMFVSNFYNTSLTGYHPVREQTDSTPDVTADGTKFDINIAGDYRYVALSRDLLTHFNRRGAKIKFGDYIIIKGTPDGAQDGIYQVRDTMNKRHTEWIDILLTPGDKSFYYRNVMMYKIDDDLDVDVIKDIYDQYPNEQPIAMVEPEVKL